MALIIGLESFLNQALIPFFIFLLTFPIYILFLCAPGGGGYYLYWLFHRRVERWAEKRRDSLSHHDTPLRRARHRIFVIFGLMNGLLTPLVIGLVAIIDHEILSDWLKEDEGRLPTFLLAIIGFVGILVMIPIHGKMMGVKLTLILITLTALSFMINNTLNHIVQAPKIIKISYYDVKTIESLGYYVFAAMGWLGPGLILFWLHALFQQSQLTMDPRAQHERAVIIKHVGIALYLGSAAAVFIYTMIDSMRIMPYRDLGTVFFSLVIPIPIPMPIMPPLGFTFFPFTSMLYALIIMLIYWRSMQPSFLGRLMISLLPSLLVNGWTYIMLYTWGVARSPHGPFSSLSRISILIA